MFDSSSCVEKFRLGGVGRVNKLSSVDLVHSYMYLVDKALREGILSLEEDISGISDELQRLCVSMVTEGITIEAIEDIIHLKLSTGPDDCEYRFRLCINWIGSLLLQSGVNPGDMTNSFKEIFGDDADLLDSIRLSDIQVKETNVSGMYIGGKGFSIADAVIINSSSSIEGVDAEYRYIESILGDQGVFWDFNFQELHFSDNTTPYDKISVQLENGTSREFFFDISAFYGKL